MFGLWIVVLSFRAVVGAEDEVLSRCDIEGFDLSPLALTRGNWLDRKGNHSYSINVCRGVNQPSPCPASTAVCMSGDGSEGVSIGEISTTHLDYTDSILTLTYTGSDLCPSTKSNYKTVIQFLCNEEDKEGTPTLLSSTGCTYIFLWSTKYACSNRIVAEGCKLTDTLSGKSLSLSSLSSQPWTAHAVTDSYDISAVAVKSLSGKAFNVPITDVVSPGYTKTVAGGGLPDGNGGCGDLIIHFDVQFPTSLRPEQKMLLKTGLALPKTLTAEQQAALTSVKNAFA